MKITRRARIFSDVSPAGRYWVYEIHENSYIRCSGLRLSWQDAFAAVKTWLR